MENPFGGSSISSAFKMVPACVEKTSESENGVLEARTSQ